MKKITMEVLSAPTHRLELLNALGFVLWGLILSLGMNYPQGMGIASMYASLETVMKIPLWGTLFICLGVFQFLGLVCAIRWIRVHACGVSATIVCMLVYMFGRLDVRYPFVTFGSTWALALWIAMIHDISTEKLTMLFRWRPKIGKRMSSVVATMIDV